MRFTLRSLLKPPTRYVDMNLIVEGHEPMNYNDAIHSKGAEKSIHAMKEEINSMNQNCVWKLVPPPEGANIMGSRCVFKIKKDINGTIQDIKLD